MNLDHPDDHRELNISIDNYLVTEVVAVPENFEIKSYLSMREQANIFKAKGVHLKQIEALDMAVKHTAIFSSMNNALINPSTVMYYLGILDELNLILKSFPSAISTNKGDYLEFCKNWDSERYTLIRGQEVKRISFVIVNIVQLLKQNIIDEAIETVNSLILFQNEANKNLKELTEA